MRFHVDSDVLAEAVGWTARCLPGRPTVPILAGMLLHATGDRLTLAGFDYEVAGECHVAIGAAAGESSDRDPTTPGRALVSGRLLAEITRSLPPGPVEVTSTGAKVVLRAAGTRFTLQTLAAADYPALPGPPPVAGAVGSDAFAAAIGQVCLAAARDDTLPVLAGVRIELRGPTLLLSCTDRYRIAVRELPWRPVRPDIAAVALVPARTLANTARWLVADAEVTLALSDDGLNRNGRGAAGPGGDGLNCNGRAAAGPGGDGLIGFGCDDRHTVSRLLETSAVNYVAKLPLRYAGRVDVATAPFLDAVRRVALVAARHTPVRLTFQAGQLVLEAATGDEAHAVAELPAELTGAGLSIAFNPQFLLDGLSAVESDTTRLEFTEAGRPALITGKPAGPDADPGYRYLLMPVRSPL